MTLCPRTSLAAGRALLLASQLLASSALITHAIASPDKNCECLWQGSFNRSASRAELIVSGIVVSSSGNSFDLWIDKNLLGVEYRQTIRIWTDNGELCRPQIADFPPESEWLLALKKIDDVPAGGFNPDTPNISFGRSNDYYLSRCGANWLQVHDGFATGNLIKGPRWQWKNEKMNPVHIELIDANLKGHASDNALLEAAKPQTASKELMNQTRFFLEQQDQ